MVCTRYMQSVVHARVHAARSLNDHAKKKLNKADMKRSIVDYFKKKNVSETEETNEAVVGGAGEGLEEATGISDSSEEDSDRLAKEAGGSGEKKKKYSFQPQWLAQFPWLRYEGQTMVCVYCRTCGPSVAGRTHFVNGSTQFKVQSLKLLYKEKYGAT